jgi:S-adenosyl methyltransferase
MEASRSTITSRSCCYLPGKDNYAADRAATEAWVAVDPGIASPCARALLTSAPEDRTAYIHADLRAPQAILAHLARARWRTTR